MRVFLVLSVVAAMAIAQEKIPQIVIWPSDSNIIRSHCLQCVEEDGVFLMRPSIYNPDNFTYHCRSRIIKGSPVVLLPFFGSYSCGFIHCDDPHIWALYTYSDFTCTEGKCLVYNNFIHLFF